MKKNFVNVSIFMLLFIPMTVPQVFADVNDSELELALDFSILAMSLSVSGIFIAIISIIKKN